MIGRQQLRAVLALASITVAAIIVVTALGHADAEGDVLSADIPVIRSAAGGPGTSLGDGFRVARGTTLVGAPTPLHPQIGVGWSATLLIDAEDVMVVLADYARQAEQAGMSLRTGPGCKKLSDVTYCSASARKEGKGDDRRTFVAAIYRGKHGDLVLNHAVLRVSDGSVDWDYTPEGIDGAVVEPGRFDYEWPPLADVGDRIGTGDQMCHNVVVQSGSRLAAPARVRGNHTEGVEAIFEVTGEASGVLDRYLQHLADSDCSIEVGNKKMRHTDGDATVTIAYAGAAGGDGFMLTLVERRGEPTWLTIDGSHD